jgi:predicted metal-binding protein
MKDKTNLDSLVKEADFGDYRWIDPKDIVVANWVRMKCIFGCEHYGRGACPPNVPSVRECADFFKEYESGVLIKLDKFADRNSYPSAWSKEMTDKLLDLERKIFLAGYQKTFLLNQSCCTLCKECLGRAYCRNKGRTRPSPESFAVDVYDIVRKSGMEINVVADNPSQMSRISILLIE